MDTLSAVTQPCLFVSRKHDKNGEIRVKTTIQAMKLIPLPTIPMVKSLIVEEIKVRQALLFSRFLHIQLGVLTQGIMFSTGLYSGPNGGAERLKEAAF